MASDVDGLPKVGQGFFSAKGQLKSSEQLRSEQMQSAQSGSDRSAPLDSSRFSSDSISAALRANRKEFRSDTSAAISVVNRTEASIDKAADVVDRQLKSAKDLKRAIKDGDTKGEKIAREELAALDSERAKVKQAVDDENNALAPSRVSSISLGNRQLGRVKVEKVEFEQRGAGNLSGKDDVDKLITGLKADRASLTDQRGQVRQARREVREISKAGEERLAEIEGSQIRRFDQAQRTASGLADRISSGAQEAFAFSVNESVVRSLLQ